MTAPDDLTELIHFRNEFTRFMMSYKFGIDELMTKINILKEEFTHIHQHSPIEHVSSRLKSPESIFAKAQRKGYPLTFEGISKNIVDIAGIRISCAFISDVYKISELLTGQADVTLVETKDYILHPKPNGYKSLHLILQIPVFMTDRVQPIFVEIQIRTIAMDFWASLEHKIFYKYSGDIPGHLLAQLTEAAGAAHQLDVQMERINDEVAEHKSLPRNAGSQPEGMPTLQFSRKLLESFRDEGASRL